MKKNKFKKQKKTESKTDYNKSMKVEADYAKQGTNDISWYNRFPALLESSASIPYGYPLGLNFNISGLNYENKNDAIPGIGLIPITLTPGVSASPTSPLNVASNTLFTKNRRFNSGSTNYDAPDQMIYFLAMDSCYALYSFMVRMYKLTNTTSVDNRYIPRYIIEAMGYDYTDFRANMAKMYYDITNYGHKLAQLNYPKSLSFTDRHMYMFENVYLDDATRKGQMYAFVPHGIYYMDHSEQGLSLHPYAFDWTEGTNQSWDSIMNKANTMLDLIISDQAMNIMSGDIAKAYDVNELRQPFAFGREDTCAPIYDPEILVQIQNIETIPFRDAPGVGNIWSTVDEATATPYVQFTPECSSVYSSYTLGVKGALAKHVITMPIEQPNTIDTVLATRFKPALQFNGFRKSNDYIYSDFHIVQCGSELAHPISYFRLVYSDNTVNGQLVSMERLGMQDTIVYSQNHIADVRRALDLSTTMSVFNWHPVTTWVLGTFSEDEVPTFTQAVEFTFGNISNYGFVTDEILSNIHNSVLTSMLFRE